MLCDLLLIESFPPIILITLQSTPQTFPPRRLQFDPLAEITCSLSLCIIRHRRARAARQAPGTRSSHLRPSGARIRRVHVHGSRTQQLKLNGQQATRPTLFTESTVVHFVQADLRPAGIRNVRDHMCVKGGRIAQDGSGNQTPMGGKFTRTRSRGENCGAF